MAFDAVVLCLIDNQPTVSRPKFRMKLIPAEWQSARNCTNLMRQDIANITGSVIEGAFVFGGCLAFCPHDMDTLLDY